MIWWSSYLCIPPSRSLELKKTTISLFSDASLDGWGCAVNDCSANGSFAQHQSGFSINTKELLAIYYGVCSLADKLKNHHILCYSDNTTVVATVNKKGSQNKLRDRIVFRLYAKLQSLNSSIVSTHLSRIFNGRADFLSRNSIRNERTEWSICPDTKQFILRNIEFVPNMDLFASHLNYQFVPYCSLKRDPHCFQVDCFTLDWNNWRAYAFLPFCLLNRCLAKIESDQVKDLMMIIPVWPSSTYFSTLLCHLKGPPVLLPPNTAHQLFLPWDRSKN